MPTENLGPAAFLSYAHGDDELGEISRFRERLQYEVDRHLGRRFPIFFDRSDLGWGDNWDARIRAALGGVTVLIPILSPGYFNSEYCRVELQQFLERERELGRDDLILPVYFIDTPLVEDPAALGADPLASVLASRQYADWRELRHDQRQKSGSVSRAMTRLAIRLRDTAARISATPSAAAPHAPERAAARKDGAPPAAEPAHRERSRTRQPPPDTPSPPVRNAGAETHPAATNNAKPSAPAPAETAPTAEPRFLPPHPGVPPVPASPTRSAAAHLRALRGAAGPAAPVAAAAAMVLLLAWAAVRGPPVAKHLLHLGALPPLSLPLICPAPQPGERLDLLGRYDPAALVSFWNLVAIVSVVGVALLVLACYQLPRRSLGPGFVRGWYACLGGAALYAAAVPPAVAALVPVRAMAATCAAHPLSFPVHLPMDALVPRMLAGAVWGVLAFTAASLVATRLAGQGPWAGGFFHYRGCPWPRWSPGREVSDGG